MQLMWSKDIIVANITLRNSPFWHLHPYDCTNVTVSNVTILSPVSGAPNTDGIDPGILATPVYLVAFQYVIHILNTLTLYQALEVPVDIPPIFSYYNMMSIYCLLH